MNNFSSVARAKTIPSLIGIFFLFLFSLSVMVKQLASSNYFSCVVNDAYTYTSWAWQFDETLRQGIIYPRWMPLDFWGYGSPTFIIASPMSFYLTSLFNLFTGNLIAAINLTKLLSLFIAATCIFLLIKEICPGNSAFFTACLYIFSPGNIKGLYAAGSYPSTISLMWFPMILFFIYKYFEEKRFTYLLYAGSCYGGLLLTHLINGYMFTIFLLAFVVYMSTAKKRFADIVAIPVVILCGVAISAAYVFPIVYEKNFLNYQAFLWNYGDLFILPNHTDKFDADFFWRKGYYQTVAYVVILFAVTLLLSLIIRRQSQEDTFKDIKTVNLFFLCVVLVSIFFLFGISSFVWEYAPFFKYVQYPSRWLVITDFAVILLTSAFFLMIEDKVPSKRKRFLLLLMPFLLCSPLSFTYMWSGCTFDEHTLIPAKGINVHKNFLPVGIDEAIVSVNGEADDNVRIISGKGSTEVLEWKSEERIIGTSTDRPVTLRIRTFNFPGWTARIDNIKSEIRTEKGSGAILVDIPSGEHRLILRFQDTPIRYYGKILSLTTIISSFVICCYCAFRPSSNRS